jgi:hypothetical protein
MAAAADQEQNQKEKEGEVVNLEVMATPLRLKGKAQSGRKKSVKKTPKAEKGKKPSPNKTTFADVVGTRQVPKPPDFEYNKCMVSFAIRVDKGKNTKGAFDKKLAEGLSFLQTYLDKQACFFPFGKDHCLYPNSK